MKIDKSKLIKSCFKKEEEDLSYAINKIVIARDESPLPNESHSDTSRIQADKMLTELNSKFKELKKLLDKLPKTFDNNSKRINFWSYAEITNKNQIIKLILVPDGYGGREFNDVRLISISTPLGKILYDKSPGELFTFNDIKYTIKFSE